MASPLPFHPLLFALSLIFGASQLRVSSWRLTPPLGYSIQLKTQSLDGVHVYACADGDWLPHSASATLVDSTNPSSKIGKYSFVYIPRQPSYVGTWILDNSHGDAAESGSPVSLVSGRQIVSFSTRPGHLPEFLAEASLHESYGTASVTSYISRLNTNGGVAPQDGYCEENATVNVPFSAEFYLWKQDVVPPSVPQALKLDLHQRPVQSFFAKGVVKYVFNGEEWIQRKITAQMYDLPGGVRVGSYLDKPEEDSHWTVNNPHGFDVTGKKTCDPVTVESSSLPWSLMAVTSSSGNASLLGPYSYIQMVSTNGGLAPRLSKATKGKVWRSPFSTIFWFYCGV